MSVYSQRRRTWLYCQRSLREMIQRARDAADAQEMRASLKRNQRWMALERRYRHTIDSVPTFVHHTQGSTDHVH